MAANKESHFEDEVVHALTTRSGWTQGSTQDLDLATGINSADLVAFIGDTQPEMWAKWRDQYPDADTAQKTFRQYVAEEIDQLGTIHVLRKGIRRNGCRFELCAPRPASRLNPVATEHYLANRLAVTRQQRYNAAHNNTLDVVLWVNGLAIATVELKNPLTHQNVEHAIEQYRSSARDPKDPFLSKRAVVHFAVDPHLAFMTTKLAGDDTRFLPFNQGHNGRQGNPPATVGPDGETRHATAYLWDEVWERDAFLDLVLRFIHTEVESSSNTSATTTSTVIFPRYHQWDCVRKLEAHAKAMGPGHRYLAQHSAGSGKSNSIAWLAHRLHQLHDDHEKPVFDKVIVITDRRVLDDQLSGTVQQFESTPGVVRRVDGKDGAKNKGLAEALNTETARIILCTLQTFSHVDKALAVGRRSYAVIVDEAHSSQTGEAAADLKGVLGAKSEEERLAMAEKVEAGEPVTGEDRIAEVVAARGRQDNLSFFAFTATPKARTVELFGTLDPETGLKEPFHVYSMRQAIEEKFILDVLRNYTTFDVYWKVRHGGSDDPDVPKAKASAAIAKQVSLHPHNVAQRAKIIVDHFRQHVAHHIDGTAKAMIVTASRLHAVRYKQAIDQYLADQQPPITDTRALVAFSGKVLDPDDAGSEYTESSMNGFGEGQTGDRFKGEKGFPVDGYQLLIVAEKYQTGFDAPRLLAMYVDKKLEGVNAVQTLARLNRSFPGKGQPFVLDFRNDADTIIDAFRPWFDTTIVEPVDANVLYRMQGNLQMAGVFSDLDVDHYWEVFAPVALDAKANNSALYQALAGPRQRFGELDEPDQDAFRSDLDSFCRAYSFLSQIVDWSDADLEKLYVFARSLLADLPKPPGDGSIDVGKDIALTHLRIETRGTVDAGIGDNDPEPLDPFPGGGSSGSGNPETERLSAIVHRLNEKYGYQLSVNDALLFEQFKGDWLADDDLAAAARANTFENFMILFAKKFMGVVFGRMDINDEIFAAIANNEAFAADLRSTYGRDLYEVLREA